MLTMEKLALLETRESFGTKESAGPERYKGLCHRPIPAMTDLLGGRPPICPPQSS